MGSSTDLPALRKGNLVLRDCGNFQLELDQKAKVIRVLTNVNPVKGFKPIWHEAAVYKTSAEWEEGSYCRQVLNESYLEEIIYFWIDIARDTNDPSH